MATETTKAPAAAIAKRQTWEALPKGLPQMRACLDQMKAEIAKALPRAMPIERFLRVATTALSTNPELLECTTLSVVGGVVLAAQLGLELGGPLGQAYLVPYKGVATFIPGYRGMIDLSRRSGSVSVIEAVVVHKRDKLLLQQGTDAKIEHSPYIGEGDPGAAIGVYAVCRFRDGSAQFVFMTKREVESIKKRSKGAASSFSGWTTDPEEMWKKTAIRRLWKVLPVSVEKTMAKAIVAHDRAESGNPIGGADVFESGDLFGTDDAPIEGEFEKGEPKSDAPADAKPSRRTTKRETEQPTGDAGDPAAELRAIHEKIRAEDVSAFCEAWETTNAQSVDLAKKSVDEMVVARDRANEWAAHRKAMADRAAKR